jgi:hypothetical protein
MRRAIIIVVVALGLTAGLVAYAGGQQQSQPAVGTLPPMFVAQQTPTPTSASSPVALRLVTPTPLPTSSSTPVPRPLATPATSAAPATSIWSLDDCSFALSTMELDHSLDATEATEVAAGTDPQHYPASYAAQYQQWVIDWGAVVSQVQGICGTPAILPTWAETSGAQADFQLAITSHQIDEADNPQNTTWDSTWIANYQRMIDLYGELPCPAGDSSSQDTQCSPPDPGEPTGLS